MVPRKREHKPPAKLRPLLQKPLTANQLEIANIPWSMEPILPPTFQQRGFLTQTPASPRGLDNSAAPQNTGVSHSSTVAWEANSQPVSWENLDVPQVPIDSGIEAASDADEKQDLLAMWTNGSLELPAGAWGDPNVELAMGQHDLSEKARAVEFRETKETQKYQISEQICDLLFLAPINHFEEEFLGLKKTSTGPKRKIND